MLACKSLSVHVGARLLLDTIDLLVAQDEVVAVLGENGAGKSTLVRMLAGDRLPATVRASGDVFLNGRPVRSWSVAQRARRRAVLPQQPDMAFAFTALEVAAMGRFPHGGGNGPDDVAIARAALTLADASHLAHRDVTTLSGGERARVHLAAVFAQFWEHEAPTARFVLLDEPSAALDLSHQHELLLAVRAFAAERGIGVLMVLHDLNLAAQYADRVVVLQRGRVLATGTPRDVLDADTIGRGFAVAACVLPHPLAAVPLIATASARAAR
jgi:iron complex transport system ATP-binding protein